VCVYMPVSYAMYSFRLFPVCSNYEQHCHFDAHISLEGRGKGSEEKTEKLKRSLFLSSKSLKYF
jgi:hypothetical protein